MSEPQKPPSPARFDSNDILFYAGLLLLGIGLAFGVSWQTALMVVGATLTADGLINSFTATLLWFHLSKKK